MWPFYSCLDSGDHVIVANITTATTQTIDFLLNIPQVTVFNVGVHATAAQLEKLLKANGIECKKIRKPPSISHAVLAFEVSRPRGGQVNAVR